MREKTKKMVLWISIVFSITWLYLILLSFANQALAKPPPRSKFYDFSEQLIDGQINKPTTLYTDARQKVRFDRLLRLKKSFLPDLFKTSRERVFK